VLDRHDDRAGGDPQRADAAVLVSQAPTPPTAPSACTWSKAHAVTRFLDNTCATRDLVSGRIAETARKHAIADEDMRHAVRNAIAQWRLDDDFMTKGTTMHSDEEIERAAKLAEVFDPSDVAMDDTTDLRAVAEAVDRVRAGEARVRELVALARANGRSWGEIGIALGVSRQAARERFSEKLRA